MKKTIYEGKKIRLTVADVVLPNGRSVERELVEHPGAVVILPLFDDGRVLFEDHYRASIDGRILELPAGTLEPGEEPIECARRELAEETGLEAQEVVHLATFYTSPGVLTEKMHAYLARGLSRGDDDLQDDEVMEPVEIPMDEALEMAAAGRLADAKTIATLFLARAFLAREGKARA